MRTLLMLSCVASFAVARPEPPVFTEEYGDHEYFGEGEVGGHVGAKTIVLLKGNGGGDGIYTTGGGGFTSGGGGYTSGGEGYTSGSGGYTGGSGGFGGHTTGSGGFGGHTTGSGGFGGHTIGGSGGFGGHTTGGGGGFGGHTGGAGTGSGTGGFNGFEQQSVVQKHIYVHLPPPESEISAPPQVIAPPPPKKHYKIVFIKAPTNPTPAAPVLPVPQQDQEKTLIYVLHKHPADSAPIVIPTAPPTPPSKPEVYFIRYKTQKEISPTHGPYGSTTLGPHYSSTFAPVSSTLGHPSTAISIVPRPSPHPSYSTTANYH